MSEEDEMFTADVEKACALAEMEFRLKETQALNSKEVPSLSQHDIAGVEGLQLILDFISPDEEKTLLSHINRGKWNTTLARRTQHFGFLYDYRSRMAAVPTDPIPEWSFFVTHRMIERGLLQKEPDQVIVNEYLPGQGIAPHVDSVHAFHDGIASLSLGSQTVMNFSKESLQKSVILPRRSLLIMHGQARYDWKHGITARKTDNGVSRCRRVSLTYRSMSSVEGKQNWKRMRVE